MKPCHTDLIPNGVLGNMIAAWCCEQRISFKAERVIGKHNKRVTNKAALEGMRMTISFLVNKLKGNGKKNNDKVNVPLSVEYTNDVLYKLRVLAKGRPEVDGRGCRGGGGNVGGGGDDFGRSGEVGWVGGGAGGGLG